MIRIDENVDEFLMKVETWPVENLSVETFGLNKDKGWTRTLMPPLTTSKTKTTTNALDNLETTDHQSSFVTSKDSLNESKQEYKESSETYHFSCDTIDKETVDAVSLQLLAELRAAKLRHLVCSEVSIPCDLTQRIAAEIIQVSEKEPCGLRGCTIFIEFEDESKNLRRIGSLKVDTETVSTFEIFLTLRQDSSGWTALLPQFLKNLARTITISPKYTITKNKLYSPHETC